MNANTAKRGTRKVERRPLECRWYLADDARTEQGGKISLLGLYLDDTVVIEMPPEEAGPTVDEPIAIEGLTILCVLHGFEGSSDFELTLTDVQNPSIGLTRTLVVQSTTAAGNITLLSKFRPILIHSFGEKVFSIASPAIGFKEEFVFRIVRRDIGSPPQPGARISLKPPLQVPQLHKRTSRKGPAKKRAPIK